MTVDQMVNRISEVYPYWRAAIQEMDDRRIVAIYKSMERDGRFERASKATKPEQKQIQLTIWDILNDGGIT